MTLLRPNAVRDPFRRNAYRVLALPGEASWSEIARAAERLRELESWGAWSSPWDLTLLGTVRREPADVDAAFARLSDSTLRLVDRLFWFHERDAESAVAYLTAASIRDALEGWSTTTLPVAKHDAAVVALLAAITLDEDVEDPALWARMLREWTEATGKDEYWLEVMRVEMEAGFETSATLGDLRDLREAALGHVAGVLLDRAREAVIDGDGQIATRALAILRAELSADLFDQLCGELATHVWGGAPPATPLPGEADAGAREPAARPSSGAAPGHAGPIDLWRRVDVVDDDARAPASAATASPPPAKPDPRDSWAPLEAAEPEAAQPESPAPVPKAETPAADEPPKVGRRAMTAHLGRLRATAAGRPPTGLEPETARPQDATPAAPASPPPAAESRPAARVAPRRDASEPAVGRPAEPVAPEPAAPEPVAPEPAPAGAPPLEPEPSETARADSTLAPARLPRIPRRVLAGVAVTAAAAMIALLAPWPRTSDPLSPVAATSTGDPVRATLIARIDAADDAIARLLVERSANRVERVFLRRTIADYQILIDDYDWRMEHGLPYDPTGYRRVGGYLGDDLAQYRAATSEDRALTDRFNALIRERSRLVAQYNERVR